MKHAKFPWKKLLFPPLWVVLMLAVISAAVLTAVFTAGKENTIVAYVSYLTAFYSLVILCLACWKTLPAWYKRTKEKFHQNTYAARYLTDAAFKIRVSLYIALLIDMIYVAVNGAASAIYRTFWFGIFAVYHAVMAIMRFVLARYAAYNELGAKRQEELRRVRLCGYILFAVNLSLLGAVLMMIYFDRGFSYYGVMIYVMALYTFYMTATAIVDLIKLKKYNSPVMSAAKVIKLTGAMVSMLSLETAMLSQFGTDTAPQTRRIMIAATGAGICIIIAVMAVYMIVRSTKELRLFRKRNTIYGTSN